MKISISSLSLSLSLYLSLSLSLSGIDRFLRGLFLQRKLSRHVVEVDRAIQMCISSVYQKYFPLSLHFVVVNDSSISLSLSIVSLLFLFVIVNKYKHTGVVTRSIITSDENKYFSTTTYFTEDIGFFEPLRTDIRLNATFFVFGFIFFFFFFLIVDFVNRPPEGRRFDLDSTSRPT